MLEYTRGWQAADKIVFSRTLAAPTTSRTRLEREFDPVAVARWKEESDADLSIDGPTIATEAIRAGLVDEYHLLIAPVVVGGGRRFFPDGVALSLRLQKEHHLPNGLVLLEYVPR
ncbi:dihydrofolate reductase family protein [Microbacterium sp.]|uniref:dihydrofolate reductase family protein n=1 Tax=Microbacterium sp. TaxID=51671 RepID=UPI0037370F2C